MADLRFEVKIAVNAVAAALCLFACAFDDHASKHHSADSQIVSLRIGTATRVVGVGEATPLRVIGVLAGGDTHVLKPGEAHLNITPPRAGRVLPNYTLHPDMKGELYVQAAAGVVKSELVRFEAVSSSSVKAK